MRAGWSLLLAFSAAVAAIHPAEAHAASCSAPRAPLVIVEMASATVSHDEALGIVELARMQSTHTLVSAASRAVFGLTESSRDARIAITSTAAKLGAGRYCAALDRIRVVMTPRLAVHIAREAAVNTCFREQVLAHEMRHVEVERSFARAEVEYVRSRLQEVATDLAGHVLASGESQTPWLRETTRQLSAELRRISDEIIPERQARHKAEVDDPDQGAATRLCDGFGKELIENYRQQVAAASAG
jgi:hypothetical protein